MRDITGWTRLYRCFDPHSSDYSHYTNATSKSLSNVLGHDGLYLYAFSSMDHERVLAIDGPPYNTSSANYGGEKMPKHVTSYIDPEKFWELMKERLWSYRSEGFDELMFCGIDSGPGWERWLGTFCKSNQNSNGLYSKEMELHSVIWFENALDAIQLKLML